VSGAANAEPPRHASDASERKQVSVTVYNGNVGLVRERRELRGLGAGRSTLELRDVAATIRPETVLVRAGGDSGLEVLEQNYRYDLLTPSTLLEKHVGRDVRLYRYHEATGKEERLDARLLSVAERPVLQIGDEITFDVPGRFGFASLPPELVARPTLEWLVNARSARPSVELSYLASGLNWTADYVLVTKDDDRAGSLTGWVTLTNQSGLTLRGVELQLVAGDVNVIAPPTPPMAKSAGYGLSTLESRDAAPAFVSQGLFEYHLYTLGRPTDLLDQQQKQVQLLEGDKLKLEKRLVLDASQDYWYRGQVGELPQDEKADVYLSFQNDDKSGLGEPLPAGVVRVYKADREGRQQFVGEDRLEHTPKDEKVELRIGKAFDVVASRRQVEFTQHSNCTTESAWEIELRNHKGVEVVVEVRERPGGDFQVLESSVPSEKRDAHILVFSVRVAKDGKTKLTYRTRTRYC
jgi:hypothetical protein